MEKTKPKRRRRSAKPKVENHYKVLGLRSNTRHERIKEKYIQLVKEYPPEQYPEEFERIRRAYETLRDPIKRQEYDLMRKFGGSLEKLRDQALEYMEQEKWDQAEKLFYDILKVAPSMNGARVGIAQIKLIQNDLREFEKQTHLLFESVETKEKQAGVLALKAKLLIDTGYADEALTVLNLIKDEFPDYANEVRGLFIQVYQDQGREDEAMELFEAEIPSLEAQEPDHIFLFIAWSNAMIDMEKWQLSDKIQKRVRKFLKAMKDKDEDEKFMITSALISEYEYYSEMGYFRGAAFFMDLLFFLDPKHPLVLESRANVQALARVHKEIERLMGDDELFPLVTTQALTWFYDETDLSDVISEYKDMIPEEIWSELELLDEEFAVGIKRVQKKYPLIYRRYKKEWDALFEEKTAGLNREARRRLK